MVKFKNIKPKQKQSQKPKKKEVKVEKKPEEKNTKKREFPNIYRAITERKFWLYVISILSVIGMVLIGIGFWRYIGQVEEIKTQRAAIGRHSAYLRDLAIQYPGDRDIFLQLALDQYSLGDMKQANIYVEKSLVLDPNYLPALKLKGIIITHK